MIRLENVTKTYRTKAGVKPIVSGLSLSLPKGRSVGLLGRNGAGKSTLLRIMSGAEKPDSGRVVHQGRISFPLGLSVGLHRELSGAQNARFVARIYGVNPEILIEHVRDFAELGAHLNEPVRTYSSGMRARLSFGISIGIRFDAYLVDELTAVGDADFRAKSRRAFQERLAGADVIMVSHSSGTLREYCDAGMVLEGGRLEVFDDLEDAIARHAENMARHGEVESPRRARRARRQARRARRQARRARLGSA